MDTEMDYTKKIFETAQKMVDVLDQSELPQGEMRAAAIKMVATLYHMDATDWK